MTSAARIRPPAADTPKRRAAADPAMEALQHFRLIFKSVKKHFHWVEQQTGVNGALLWAMAVAVDKPGLKVSELATALAIHQSTASNLVDKLVKQGFLRRERSTKDQRIVHLFPEPAGARLIAGAPKPLQGVLPDALRHMSGAELRQLNELLLSLAGKMKVRDTSGKSTPLASI